MTTQFVKTEKFDVLGLGRTPPAYRHPCIHHISFPIPNFIKDLSKPALNNILPPLFSHLRDIKDEIAFFTNSDDIAWGPLAKLKGFELAEREEFLENLYTQYNTTMNIFEQCEAIVNANQEQYIKALCAPTSKSANPSASEARFVRISPKKARKILNYGLLYVSNNTLCPTSEVDLEIEIDIINRNIAKLKYQSELITAKITAIEKRDFVPFEQLLSKLINNNNNKDDILDADEEDCESYDIQHLSARRFLDTMRNFNPYATITLSQLKEHYLTSFAPLTKNRRGVTIDTVNLTYNLVPNDPNIPDLSSCNGFNDANNNNNNNMLFRDTYNTSKGHFIFDNPHRKIDLIIKQAILPTGFGYFFQVDEDNDFFDTFHHHDRVFFQVVQQQEEEQDILDNADNNVFDVNTHNDKVNQDNSIIAPLLGIQISPLLSSPPSSKIKNNNKITKCTKHDDVGHVISHTTIRNTVITTTTTTANNNTNNANTNNELDFLYSIVSSLKQNSTHYTVRLYFNNSQPGIKHQLNQDWVDYFREYAIYKYPEQFATRVRMAGQKTQELLIMMTKKCLFKHPLCQPIVDILDDTLQEINDKWAGVHGYSSLHQIVNISCDIIQTIANIDTSLFDILHGDYLVSLQQQLISLDEQMQFKLLLSSDSSSLNNIDNNIKDKNKLINNNIDYSTSLLFRYQINPTRQQSIGKYRSHITPPHPELFTSIMHLLHGHSRSFNIDLSSSSSSSSNIISPFPNTTVPSTSPTLELLLTPKQDEQVNTSNNSNTSNNRNTTCSNTKNTIDDNINDDNIKNNNTIDDNINDSNINDVINRHRNRMINTVQEIVDENEVILQIRLEQQQYDYKCQLEQQQYDHNRQVVALQNDIAFHKDEITLLNTKCYTLTQSQTNLIEQITTLQFQLEQLKKEKEEKNTK